MSELLASDVVTDLEVVERIVYWACGLSVPFIWSSEDTS